MWTSHDHSMIAANGVFCEVVLGGQKALERSYSAVSEKGFVNSKGIFSCFRKRMMGEIIVFSHSGFGMPSEHFVGIYGRTRISRTILSL